jgi:ankyrin repeat protein
MSRSGGPFQEAALRGDVDEFKRLTKYSVDANTPNLAGCLAGCLALYTFCSALRMYDELLLDEQVLRPAMGWLIQHTNDINTPDRDGITALHITSIMSQSLSMKYIERRKEKFDFVATRADPFHRRMQVHKSDSCGMLYSTSWPCCALEQGWQ